MLKLTKATGANKALSNLASVAINTSLISDTDNIDDLGGSSKAWKDLFLKGILSDGTYTAKVKEIAKSFMNIMLAFFKISVLGGLSKYNLIDGLMDEFEDETGVDAVTSTNESYDSVNDLYSPLKISLTELDYFEYSTNALAQAAYVSSNVTKPAVTQSQLGESEGEGLIIPNDGLAQGFQVSTADNIAKFTFRLCKYTASPTGTLTAYIYSDTAGVPNAAVATFSNISANSLSAYATYTDYEFTGSFTPTASTQYHMVLIWTGGTSSDRIQWKIQSGNPYVNGTIYTKPAGGAWAAYGAGAYDNYFKLYQDVLNLQCYSEGTIKSQGSYSLKGFAEITTSLNDTLTRTVSPTIDLSNVNTIKYWIYASRTGSNIKVGFRDSGLNVIEHTPNITVADTWQEQTVDISAVSNANKDAIDRIIVTIVNADANNTFYFDNMFAPAYTYNMTLVSNAYASVATPTKSRIVLFEEDVDSSTINTDLKAYLSRDGGTTWTQHTLADEGYFGTGQRLLSSDAVDISGQPSGVSMKWKVETLNNKNLKLHAVGLNWN